MPELTEVLRELKPNGPGIRLRGLLGLRLTSGNGMFVLGCSRIGVRPSAREMETVVDAVTAVFQPTAIFRANEPELRVVCGEENFIWRLYWPTEGVTAVWRPAEQLSLINQEM